MPRIKKEPRGRPSAFSKEIAAAICARLADGESLRAVCRDETLPSESTVRRWALEDREGFSAQYTRAREIGYHCMFDHMLEIADTPQEGVVTRESEKGTETRTGDMIEHRRLQVDTRKWMLARALPKIYGDKVEVDQNLVVFDAIDRPPQETREQWMARRQRELASTPVAGHADD